MRALRLIPDRSRLTAELTTSTTLLARITRPSNQRPTQLIYCHGSDYDVRGNLEKREDRVPAATPGTGAKIGKSVYIWDASGRLSFVHTYGPNGPPVKSAQYFYDAFGRRVRTADTAGGETTTMDSWYDPQVEFLELAVAVKKSTSTVVKRFWKVYGPDTSGVYGGAMGIGGLEAVVDEATGDAIGVVTDFHHNIIGYTRVQVSGGSTYLAENWDMHRCTAYGPVGSISRPSDMTIEAFVKLSAWHGMRQDGTGLYWMGARYYDPEGGRFISPDPLGHGASMDLYSYGMGDPINFLDPDGRCSEKQLNDALSDGELSYRETIGLKLSRELSRSVLRELGKPVHDADSYAKLFGADYNIENANFLSKVLSTSEAHYSVTKRENGLDGMSYKDIAQWEADKNNTTRARFALYQTFGSQIDMERFRVMDALSDLASVSTMALSGPKAPRLSAVADFASSNPGVRIGEASGTRTIAGYDLGGSTAMFGDTYKANLWGVFAKKEAGGLPALFGAVSAPRFPCTAPMRRGL